MYINITFLKWQMRNRSGFHWVTLLAFYLLTFAASHDLKETIDKDYCECGMPLETIRESESPLKERSERV